MPRECPNCGEDTVTLDPNRGTILGDPITNFVMTADHGDTLGVTAFCWECEWEENKSISIEVDQ